MVTSILKEPYSRIFPDLFFWQSTNRKPREVLLSITKKLYKNNKAATKRYHKYPY